MDAKKKRQIQAALKKLAESHASSMVFLEETLSFICTSLISIVSRRSQAARLLN